MLTPKIITEIEPELREMIKNETYLHPVNDKSIAKRFGLTPQDVGLLRRLLNLPNATHRHSKNQYQAVKKLIENEDKSRPLKDTEIAKQTDLCVQTIYNIRQEFGISSASNRRKEYAASIEK